MKNLVKMTIIGIGATMILTGCGKSAIKCDDSDAQKAVMQIAEGRLKNMMLKKEISNTSILPSMTYESMQRSLTENHEFKQIIDKIDQKYSEAKPTLINIRTESMDNELEKSQCAAEIVFSGSNKEKMNITYKLSKTSDGKLYSEIIDFIYSKK